MLKRFKVECEVTVTEDDVWDYLDSVGDDLGEDSDTLKEQGYELTDEDWRNAAEALFNDDDFTYYDFNEVR